MSDRRLTNQIYHLRPDPLVHPIRIPVLLSDSKGLFLQNQVTVKPETFIECWCYPGATAEKGLDYLRRSLASHLQKLHPMTLFVCVGTCNLITKYQNGRIELTGHNSNPAYNLINTLEDIYHCVRTFDQSVKLVFLHLPYYSISNYYKHKGEINHGQYKEDDYILQTQIDIVNHYINDTNRVLHSYTPYFSEDLVHSKRNSRYSLRTKYKYKFTLYTDGIHPKPLLDKLWLARICRLVHDF